MGEEGQDALLQQFLSEPDPSVAQDCLGRLLADHVEPVVRDITRYKFRRQSFLGSRDQDEEDIRSEAVLQLIARLQELRSSPEHQRIENFRGYVAATTYNAYHKHMRMKYPARSRLKNRIRYLMNHAPGFTMRQDEHSDYQCGLQAWEQLGRGHRESATSQEADLEGFLHSLPGRENVSRMKLAELVEAFLTWRRRPISLDDLVGTVAELQGIREAREETTYSVEERDSTVSVCELLPDPGVDVVTKMEQRARLERLWIEICQLPQRQRVALLLNLRDAQTCDALVLFTLTGIASLRRIAEVLEWPVEDFAVIWNKLPLEDTVIAANLGVTRQQVINLRKSARERLARRMVGPGNRAAEA